MYINCTILITTVCACDVAHRQRWVRQESSNPLPSISWSHLRHYRVQRVLIATGGATTMYAYDHTRTDNCLACLRQMQGGHSHEKKWLTFDDMFRWWHKITHLPCLQRGVPLTNMISRRQVGTQHFGASNVWCTCEDMIIIKNSTSMSCALEDWKPWIWVRTLGPHACVNTWLAYSEYVGPPISDIL